MKPNQSHLPPRAITSGIVLALGIIIAMVPENTTRHYRLSAAEMLTEVRTGSEFIHPDELAQWLINKDPSIQLIDVRQSEDYTSYHLPGALNISVDTILAPDWSYVFDQGTRMNILYSNGTVDAHKCWMILRQLGFENNYVLQGGLNYWTETILNPQHPPTTAADEEIARYDFRQGASQVLGNGSQIISEKTESEIVKPKVKRRSQKKAPEGGC